jgi:hypothetical protein
MAQATLNELVAICSSNLVDLTADGRDLALAVTKEGMDLLMDRLELSEVDLLQVAMSTGTLLDETLKRQLLFGLLIHRGGLVVIKENGVIIAPIPEISLGPSVVGGEISFLEEFGEDIRRDPPDLPSFCQLKGVCGGLPVHELLHFLLHKLTTLSSEDSLLGSFRLKSYTSVVNKLFYRGKPLTDLLAATVGTDAALRRLKKELVDERGAVPVDEDDTVNGNGDLTYRFVRILQVRLEGVARPFTLPIYYEVIRTRHVTADCHKSYELRRLECELGKGQKNTMRCTGFTIEPISLSG